MFEPLAGGATCFLHDMMMFAWRIGAQPFSEISSNEAAWMAR
jgi:hypothetical protein